MHMQISSFGSNRSLHYMKWYTRLKHGVEITWADFSAKKQKLLGYIFYAFFIFSRTRLGGIIYVACLWQLWDKDVISQEQKIAIDTLISY